MSRLLVPQQKFSLTQLPPSFSSNCPSFERCSGRVAALRTLSYRPRLHAFLSVVLLQRCDIHGAIKCTFRSALLCFSPVIQRYVQNDFFIQLQRSLNWSCHYQVMSLDVSCWVHSESYINVAAINGFVDKTFSNDEKFQLGTSSKLWEEILAPFILSWLFVKI